MDFDKERTETVPVHLEDGSIIRVEVTSTGHEDVAAFDPKPLTQVTDALEGIIKAVTIPIQKSQPQRATIKFGIEITTESGQLTAILVKGSGKANLEITLEWEKQDKELSK